MVQVEKSETLHADVIVHEATGVTYYFSEPVEYGRYWNGDIFVVSNGRDVVVTKIIPESVSDEGRIMHGAMLQPDDTKGNGFDSGTTKLGGYEASSNIDPTASGSSILIDAATYPKGASLVKAISLEDLNTQVDRSVIDKFSVLTITPEVPPEKSFRPPVVDDDKISTYSLSDLDFSKLQNVEPVPEQKLISDFDFLAEATYISWWSGNDPLRDFHPNSYHEGYNDYQLDKLVDAFMALHTNRNISEKELLYAAIVQQGLDYAGGISEGVRWPADGGHGNLYKPFVVTAASALNSNELAIMAGADGNFSTDEQFRYIEHENIGVEFFESGTNKNPKIGVEYQDVQLGVPEWAIANEWVGFFDPSLDADYRWVNSDNVPILALTMEMLGNGEGREIWSNEAYFDYAERVRLMHQVDVNPTLPANELTHAAQPTWMAFLEAFSGTFSAGANMQFRPEAPLSVKAFVTEGGLEVAIGGEVFSGSAPVERIDIRYRAASDDDSWTVIENFGMSGQLDGLTVGEVYFVQARYVNAVGEGAWSDNGFDARNSTLFDRLKVEGLISDADVAIFGGQREYQKTADYMEHLRSILVGDERYKELSDELLSGTAMFATVSMTDFLFDPALVSGFGGNQDEGTYTVSEDGFEIRLENNAWKQLLQDVTIEKDTVLRFNFSADVEGEIHGIGFENDGHLTPETVFQLHGTQDWGIQWFAGAYTTGSGPIDYIIPVGQFFTGDFDRLVLVMDDDNNVGADSTFSYIALATVSDDESEVPATEADDADTNSVAGVGELQVVVEDRTSSAFWESYTDVFTLEGVRISRSMTFDDGRVADTEYTNGVRTSLNVKDIGDAFDWFTRDKQYSDDGVQESLAITLDDGRVRKNVWDVSASAPWSSYLDVFDAAGTRISRTMTFDDGRESRTDFTDGVRSSRRVEDLLDEFTWSVLEERFDENGDRSNLTRTFDDGQIRETSFESGLPTLTTVSDVADNFAWGTYVDSFDGTGQRTERLFTYDDGSQELITF